MLCYACQLACTRLSCRGDHITPGMTLKDASTVSGMIWTKPYGDGERAILLPVVQHYAADFALGSVSNCCYVQRHALLDFMYKRSIRYLYARHHGSSSVLLCRGMSHNWHHCCKTSKPACHCHIHLLCLGTFLSGWQPLPAAEQLVWLRSSMLCRKAFW